MSNDSLYTVTPRKARKFITRALQSNLVPFIHSAPGLGKSTIVKQIAEFLGLKLIDHRLSTSDPTDLSGLPTRNGAKASFLPYDIFPIASDPIPVGYKGWLIFLDEFNAAHRSVQAAAYKVILDRQIGQNDLHEMALVVCAGNRTIDRAITSELSTAMQSRLIHIEMVSDHKEWLEDVAIPNNYDERIIAFLSNNPEALDDFRPDHDNKTFCCPRTWEFANNLCKTTPLEDMEEYAGLFAGTITAGVAAGFVQFSAVFKDIPQFSEIVRDPKGARYPSDRATQWAVISTLPPKITDDNFEKVTEYVGRFSSEFRVLFYRFIMITKPTLREHPAYQRAAVELSRYLHGTNSI